MSEPCMFTHVPCFPVKPWKSTLVSPLIRRFLIVSAYCEDVAYCRVADLESTERIGFEGPASWLWAVMKAELGVRRNIANCGVGGASFERAGSCGPVPNSLTSRPRPTTSRKYLVNQLSLRARCCRHARYQCDDIPVVRSVVG
jgi:hypothetical protein